MNLKEAIKGYLTETDNAMMLKRAMGAQNVNTKLINKIQADKGNKKQSLLLTQLNKALDAAQKAAAEIQSLG